MDDATDVGPLATEQGRSDVETLVDDARSKGASRALRRPGPRRARLVLPADGRRRHHPDMRMYAEEVFGPVAGLYRVESIDEAIELATAPASGSGPTPGRPTRTSRPGSSRDLDAGGVTINGMTISYPDLPFGGTKRSGYGRELSGHGIREFCNIKAVWIG